MICPQCQLDFESAQDDAVPVHNCSGCSGTWIGGRSLHAMLARSNDSASIEQILHSILEINFRESRRMCPACPGRHLKVVVIEHTELDFCSSCKGLFFDPGELERVLPAISGPSATPQQGFWSSLLRLLDKN